ncbi:MAG: bL17 family ribosomal protein [Patescibacteria group bacterium]
MKYRSSPLLFKSLLNSLFLYGTIETSEANAKAVKSLVDKVINLAKKKHSQARLQSFINDKNLQDRVIKEIIPKLGSRNSGYTSLIKLGRRLGDQTMVVRMSLIGAEELKPLEKVIHSTSSGQASNKVQVTSKKEKETPKERVGPKKSAPRKRAKKK